MTRELTVMSAEKLCVFLCAYNSVCVCVFACVCVVSYYFVLQTFGFFKTVNSVSVIGFCFPVEK